MSEQPGAGSLPELTPEQESEVRRLLTEARHDEPIPVEVGDRLDRVLAGLSRDEAGGPGVAPVIDLAARRRRRNAAALLAGAAAVIVAGFAIGQAINVDDSDAGSNADSSAAAPAERDQSLDSGEDSSGDSGGDAAGNSSEIAPSPSTPLDLPAPLVLSSASLEQDVTGQLKRSASGMAAAEATDPAALAAYGCAPAPGGTYGLGTLFPALYDGEPAVLALRPAAGATQVAEVLQCGTATELDSVTIPRR